MSAAQFTPGPWHVLDLRASKMRELGWTGPMVDSILISRKNGRDVAACEGDDCVIARIKFENRPEELPEGSIADARLIAAAPELYEQLVEAERLLANHAVHEDDLPPIRAALAKAVQQ